MLWIIVCVDGNFSQSIMNVNILAPFAHKMLKKGGQQFQPIPETGHVFIFNTFFGIPRDRKISSE